MLRTLLPAGTVRSAGAAILVAGASFFYFASYCDNSLLANDSADYINAATGGFSAIYLDTGSATPAGMYSLFRKRNEPDFHGWDYLDSRGDPASRRHFHVVLSFYPYAIAAGFRADAKSQRLVTAAEGAAVVGIAFFGLQAAGVGLAISLASALFITLSPSPVAAFVDPSPHPLFLALLLAFGFVLAAFLEKGSRSLLYMAAVLFACLIATLELSLIPALVLVAIAAARVWRRGEIPWRDFAIACLLFFATLLVVWPGGWIRGGYLVSYGILVFQALFRRGNYFGDATPWHVMLRAADMSVPVLFIFFWTAALAAYLFVRRGFNAYLEVFTLLFLGYAAQGYLNKFYYHTYVSHFTVLSWVLFALCTQRWIDTTKGPAPKAVTLAILIAAGIGAIPWPRDSVRLVQARAESSGRATAVIHYVRTHLPEGSTIITNTDAAIWHYYLARYDVEPSVEGGIKPGRGLRIRDYWALADPAVLRAGWRNGLTLESDALVGGLAIYKCHLQ